MSSAIMAALSGAAGSGLLVSDAAAQVARPRDDDDESPPPLIIAHSNQDAPVQIAHGSHRSHRSHSSHRSHYSSSGGGGYSSGRYRAGSTSTYVPDVATEPPPPPPKPARVTIVAYPGGKIFVDDKSVGRDATGTLVLKPGTYVVRIENRFVGDHTETITLTDGQTGAVTISW